jgi:hypothetical protein
VGSRPGFLFLLGAVRTVESGWRRLRTSRASGPRPIPWITAPTAYRPALELVDIVHVAHGHREGSARCTRAVIILYLSVAHESVAVADDDEHAATVKSPLAVPGEI